MPVQKKFKEYIFIILPLLFALFLLTRYLNLPPVGPNATDYNVLSLAARNFNNFGYLNLKFAPDLTLSKQLPKNPDFYLHHPSLPVIIESIFFKILGNDFWVGRISKIIPAFLILPVLFFIGKNLKNKRFGMMTLLISSLIPAAIVLGIVTFNQPWSLLFIVLTAYFSLKAIRTGDRKYFYLSVISVILGTLSDWQMTYFTPFLLPLFLKNKKGRLGFTLIATSTLTALLFLIYSYFILGSFSNLVAAILNRSTGALLLTLPLWQIRWMLVLLVRFIVYFNPLFLIISAVYIFKFLGKVLHRKLEDIDLLIFAFFACGATNIMLFPEGSFGHPFWIYFLVPFIALSSTTLVLGKIINSKLVFAAMIVFSIIFAVWIENWKTEQNVSNLFRYNLAKSASKYFIPYDTLYLNPGNYIDQDLLQYVFYQNAKIEIPNNIQSFKNGNFYLFSCIQCNLNNFDVNFLANRYKYKTFDSPPGRAYLFFLKQKQDQIIPPPLLSKAVMVPNEIVPRPESLPRKIYNLLIDLLRAPQI